MKDPNITTQEEWQELKQWFAAHELPSTLSVDKATYLPDTRLTVGSLLAQAEVCYENPRMQGCILLLKRIKERLEAGT